MALASEDFDSDVKVLASEDFASDGNVLASEVFASDVEALVSEGLASDGMAAVFSGGGPASGVEGVFSDDAADCVLPPGCCISTTRSDGFRPMAAMILSISRPIVMSI